MTANIIGGIILAVLAVLQLYTVIAAGYREFELEDSEQEKYISEWKQTHHSKY